MYVGHVVRKGPFRDIGDDDLNLSRTKSMREQRDIRAGDPCEFLRDLNAKNTLEGIPKGCLQDDPPLPGAVVDEDVGRRYRHPAKRAPEPTVA